MDWKRKMKHWLGWLAFKTGLYRRSLADRAVIIVFHRVDDDLGDNPISCTSWEFRAFCRFFKRYFRLTTMNGLLDDLQKGNDLTGKLAITFDDGYKDNHEIAAPFLEEAGIPACFFITTGFIGTSKVPWWDEEWGIESRWMSWHEVEDLARRGFEIGAHTVTHPDLGKRAGPEAAAEIRDSRDRLQEVTGQRITLFSYPFGRRDQMLEENREVVKRLGFRTCMSAFGGFVQPGDDPFHVRRFPVSPWYRSPYQLGWELIRSA